MHWLIVIPYYFFGALAVLAFLLVACRVLRLRVPIGALAATAVGASIVGLAGILAFGVVGIESLRVLPMLGLFVLSLLLAGADALLATWLPLPLDRELEEM